MSELLLSGFHGTTLSSAAQIMDSREFDLSTSSSDWLGNGIYFYYNFSDAIEWRESEAVILAIIKVDEKNCLDFDTEYGRRKLYEAEHFLCKKLNIKLDKTAQENQCSIAKVIWDSMPELEVMSASFAKTRSVHKTLIDIRKRRREFCIRNNKLIKYLHIIKKGDINE